MAKKQNGIIKFVYFAALFLLGIVIWGFYQGKSVDLAKKSLDIDNELTDSLLKLGFTNDDIVSQSREERKQGASRWVEYYREMSLSGKTNLKEVEEKMGSLARKYGSSFRVAPSGTSKTVIEISEGRALFSRLVIDSRTISKPLDTGKVKKIAIVIDDVGYSADLSRFLNLGIPITFAVFPHERFTKAVCAQLAQKKMPFILHLPMEPDAYPKIDPGKAALLTKMSGEEIKKMFLSDLATTPGAVGVSNHMGSRFTSNLEKMLVVMKLVKDKDIFFFDSATSSATQAGRAAHETGIMFAENDLFLDNIDELEAEKKQLQHAIKKANKYRHIAVIGHISRKYLPEAIKESIPDFKKNGIEFVYLTDIVSQAK